MASLISPPSSAPVRSDASSALAVSLREIVGYGKSTMTSDEEKGNLDELARLVKEANRADKTPQIHEVVHGPSESCVPDVIEPAAAEPVAKASSETIIVHDEDRQTESLPKVAAVPKIARVSAARMVTA